MLHFLIRSMVPHGDPAGIPSQACQARQWQSWHVQLPALQRTHLVLLVSQGPGLVAAAGAVGVQVLEHVLDHQVLVLRLQQQQCNRQLSWQSVVLRVASRMLTPPPVRWHHKEELLPDAVSGCWAHLVYCCCCQAHEGHGVQLWFAALLQEPQRQRTSPACLHRGRETVLATPIQQRWLEQEPGWEVAASYGRVS
jgi:hypothetical protein